MKDAHVADMCTSLRKGGAPGRETGWYLIGLGMNCQFPDRVRYNNKQSQRSECTKVTIINDYIMIRYFFSCSVGGIVMGLVSGQ